MTPKKQKRARNLDVLPFDDRGELRKIADVGIAHRGDAEYLKAIPDGNENNKRGNLPAPVAAMLERKHGSFDAEHHDYHVVSGETGLKLIIHSILH